MIFDDIRKKRAELETLERLHRRGGATLVIADDGAAQITVFCNTRRFRRG